MHFLLEYVYFCSRVPPIRKHFYVIAFLWNFKSYALKKRLITICDKKENGNAHGAPLMHIQRHKRFLMLATKYNNHNCLIWIAHSLRWFGIVRIRTIGALSQSSQHHKTPPRLMICENANDLTLKSQSCRSWPIISSSSHLAKCEHACICDSRMANRFPS